MKKLTKRLEAIHRAQKNAAWMVGVFGDDVIKIQSGGHAGVYRWSFTIGDRQVLAVEHAPGSAPALLAIDVIRLEQVIALFDIGMALAEDHIAIHPGRGSVDDGATQTVDSTQRPKMRTIAARKNLAEERKPDMACEHASLVPQI